MWTVRACLTVRLITVSPRTSALRKRTSPPRPGGPLYDSYTVLRDWRMWECHMRGPGDGVPPRLSAKSSPIAKRLLNWLGFLPARLHHKRMVSVTFPKNNSRGWTSSVGTLSDETGATLSM